MHYNTYLNIIIPLQATDFIHFQENANSLQKCLVDICMAVKSHLASLTSLSSPPRALSEKKNKTY